MWTKFNCGKGFMPFSKRFPKRSIKVMYTADTSFTDFSTQHNFLVTPHTNQVCFFFLEELGWVVLRGHGFLKTFSNSHGHMDIDRSGFVRAQTMKMPSKTHDPFSVT
jgi:hypothetical protein